METRQKFLELRRIYHEVIEEEAKKYFDRNAEVPVNQSDKEKSKVTFFNIKGDIYFLHKYQLLGDGEGGNALLRQIRGRNEWNETFTLLLRSSSWDGYNFELHLDLPNIERDDRSWFIKEKDGWNNPQQYYRFDGETMLENDDFKSFILQLFKDISPERFGEVERLIA